MTYQYITKRKLYKIFNKMNDITEPNKAKKLCKRLMMKMETNFYINRQK